MEGLDIFVSMASIVVPVVTLLMASNLKSSNKDIVNQLTALKEQGAIRGEHLEEKIVDVKLYFKEVIDEVKKDFSELKSDVGQRQMMDEAIKHELLKEVQQLMVKLKEIEKDVSIIENLYDKRIKHEGDVIDRMSKIEDRVVRIEDSIKEVEDAYKKISKAV